MEEEDLETGKAKKRSLGEKSANNIIGALAGSKNAPFENVLFGLGIRYVGRTVAEIIASRFGDIDCLIDACHEEIVKVHGIGERIAQSITSFFDIPENLLTIDRLKAAGLNFSVGKPAGKENGNLVLEGKSVVISGTFENFGRDELKKSIKTLGGKVSSAISGNTDILVAGNNMGPAKLGKAKKLGTRIISEKEFKELISGHDKTDIHKI